LTRTNDLADRRTTLVTITDAGNALIDEHSQASAEITQRLTDQFGEDRLEALLDLLEDLRKLKD